LKIKIIDILLFLQFKVFNLKSLSNKTDINTLNEY